MNPMTSADGLQARMRCLQIFDEHAFPLPSIAVATGARGAAAAADRDASGNHANTPFSNTGSVLVCDAVTAVPAYLRHVASSVAAQDLISLASRIWSALELQQMAQRVAAFSNCNDAADQLSFSNQLWSRTQFVHVCVELLPQFVQVLGAHVPPAASVLPHVSTPNASQQLASSPRPTISSSSTPSMLSSFTTLTDLGPPPHFSGNAATLNPSTARGTSPMASEWHEATAASVHLSPAGELAATKTIPTSVTDSDSDSDSWSWSGAHNWSMFRTNVFAGDLQSVFDQVQEKVQHLQYSIPTSPCRSHFECVRVCQITGLKDRADTKGLLELLHVFSKTRGQLIASFGTEVW